MIEPLAIGGARSLGRGEFRFRQGEGVRVIDLREDEGEHRGAIAVIKLPHQKDAEEGEADPHRSDRIGLIEFQWLIGLILSRFHKKVLSKACYALFMGSVSIIIVFLVVVFN